MYSNLRTLYDARVQGGEIRSDPAQMDALAALQEIRGWLEATSGRRRNPLASWLTRHNPQRYSDHPPGLYLWGGVGVGKSMLMDIFFGATRIERKRRVHFHAFMQEMHESLHRARQKGTADPLTPVAREVAQSARLLCFDELQILDITDAMLVGRLFEKLFSFGVTIVATSNRAPDELYKNGLNRQLFLPFIKLIKQQMKIHHMPGKTDYRHQVLQGCETWLSPLGPETTRRMDSLWSELCRGGPERALSLTVKARQLVLGRFSNGILRATFDELCAQPLGPADYLALAGAVRILMLENIPVLARDNAAQARRFVTLVDALYEGGVGLICSAAAQPDALYLAGEGAFEFERTASRLTEMRAADWSQRDAAQ